MNKITTTALATALALSLANNLQAEPHSDTHEPIPPSSLSARVFALGNAEVKDTAASYAISSVAIQLTHRHGSFGMERQYFDWEDGTALTGSPDEPDPWEFLQQLRLGFAHSHLHSERWMSEWMTGLNMGFESDTKDSVSLYLGGYGVYQINKTFALLMGIYYTHHPEVETDYDLLPILGLAIRPNTLNGWSAQLGFPATKATWQFDARTRLTLELNALEAGVTRLANDSPIQRNGYAELSSTAITLKFEKCLRNNLEFSAGIGHSIDREINIYDPEGDKTRSLDVERGPSIELGIRKTF